MLYYKQEEKRKKERREKMPQVERNRTAEERIEMLERKIQVMVGILRSQQIQIAEMQIKLGILPPEHD